MLTGIGIDHRLTTSLVTSMGRYELSSMYVYNIGIYAYIYIYIYFVVIHYLCMISGEILMIINDDTICPINPEDRWVVEGW